MAASTSLQFPSITPTIGSDVHSDVVSRTSISFKNQTIPICIKAYIDPLGAFYTPHKPSMVFEVEREDVPGCDIGRFSIMRIWDKIDRYGNLHLEPHFEGDPIQKGDQLRNRRLYVGGMGDLLKEDPETGSSPIVQVLTQLAIEILGREFEDELVIDTTETPRRFDATLLFSGGFTERKITLLGREIRKEGFLLKNNRDEFWTMKKDGTAIPAQVAFCANKTWEQVIQEQPLLNYAPGPIMPVYGRGL